jgi:hypothetical protein
VHIKTNKNYIYIYIYSAFGSFHVQKDNKYSFMYSLDHFTSKMFLDRLIIINDFLKKNLIFVLQSSKK